MSDIIPDSLVDDIKKLLIKNKINDTKITEIIEKHF